MQTASIWSESFPEMYNVACTHKLSINLEMKD